MLGSTQLQSMYLSEVAFVLLIRVLQVAFLETRNKLFFILIDLNLQSKQRKSHFASIESRVPFTSLLSEMPKMCVGVWPYSWVYSTAKNPGNSKCRAERKLRVSGQKEWDSVASFIDRLGNLRQLASCCKTPERTGGSRDPRIGGSIEGPRDPSRDPSPASCRRD